MRIIAFRRLEERSAEVLVPFCIRRSSRQLVNESRRFEIDIYSSQTVVNYVFRILTEFVSGFFSGPSLPTALLCRRTPFEFLQF